MFAWLTRPSESEEVRGDQSYQCDEPETPAPQFAIRALKSAFLGTPYARQHQNHGQTVVEKALPHENEAIQTAQVSTLNAASSPTKGILVTPGTGVNKRKTVSFGNLIPKDSGISGKSLTSKAPTLKTANQQGQESGCCENASPGKTRQVVMTKSLFEAQLEDSKRRISRKPALKDLEGMTIASPPKACNPSSLGQMRTVAQIGDATIDLNEPCSKSGKHWKGEYEQYHRKSNRELKRVIQHGQTIKSYAQRKDSEATCLKEILRNELAKVSRMEARVSELAAELAHARARDTSSDVSSVDLVSELAKQTALAIRYKQNADRYKHALDKQDQARDISEQADDCIRVSVEGGSIATPSSETRELSMLRKDLGQLQSAVEAAEEKSSKLQHENLTLKQKLARIKQEMRSYESRRLAREEKVKRREARLVSAKESCERKLSDLAGEHDKLLRMVSEGHKSNLSPKTTKLVDPKGPHISGGNSVQISAFHELDEIRDKEDVSRSRVETPLALGFYGEKSGVIGSSDIPNGLSDVRGSNRPPSAVSKSNVEQAGPQPTTTENYPGRLPQAGQTTKIDIWTHENPDSLVDDTTSSLEIPKTSNLSILRQETYDALAEIDQNSVPGRQNHGQLSTHQEPQCSPNSASSIRELSPQKAALCSAVRRMQSRRLAIASPRPSLLNFAASSIGPDSSHMQAKTTHTSAVGPSRNLLADSRTSTMTSKGSRLPADRAEAARKRLEARRGEKRSHVDIPKP